MVVLYFSLFISSFFDYPNFVSRASYMILKRVFFPPTLAITAVKYGKMMGARLEGILWYGGKWMNKLIISHTVIMFLNM